ncbi:hypothetical protein B9Z55_027111 [Caenorhabditis nigoni]|uniref:Uncharacterized protein n=1 Tax=Caenorhabditis nigoni TaxID=1611254 RepID=A0A2G5SIW5_9PELO|nr:hypothetical protein B9Z55_027111 [Caenorhabditis nigoni]
MESESPSTLPQIEKVIEDGSSSLRLPSVPEMEAEHVMDKEQLEPTTLNPSPEIISKPTDRRGDAPKESCRGKS